MDVQNILNTIYDNASEMYRERIPEATQTNITEIQQAMTDPNNAQVVNEFMSTLLNVLIRQELIAKQFENPLKVLKKGAKPLGDTVEEIYNNFIKAQGYDQTGADLLQRNLPDTKTVFHRMNRKDKYKITVSPDMLSKAFASYENLEKFTIKDPLKSEANAKEFIKVVKTVSGDMVFPNSNNNAYLTAQSTDTKPIVTFSRKNEQVLLIDNATDVSVNVDVLASIFNMSVAEFNDTRKIVIDAFPNKSIRAALVDENFFQIYDDLITFKSFENGEGLYTNYFLHIWQTLAYSPLVNAVIFMVADDKDSDSTVSKYTITNTLKSGITNSNNRKTVTEGSSYSAKLNGLTTSDNVSVTITVS